MLSYALGRGIEASDRGTIESIAEGMKADGDRFSTLIELIVKSYPFQHARGTTAPVGELLADGVLTGDVIAAAGPAAEEVTIYHPIFVPPEGAVADAANASSVAPPRPGGGPRANGGAPTNPAGLPRNNGGAPVNNGGAPVNNGGAPAPAGAPEGGARTP
jgi:hypothetical protein